MVPQGAPVDQTIAKLEPLLNPGDILIDGGNSNYKDTCAATRKLPPRDFSLSMWAPPAACGD
jgi:6-phosphogluconate dehydrogenase